MYIGVQSGYIYGDNDFEKGLQMIKNAGFDCIDFNIDEKLRIGSLAQKGENPFFSKSVEEILDFFRPQKEAADRIGVRYGQMHAPFPVYVEGNDAANEAIIDAVEKCMAVCALFACPYLIVHPIIWSGSKAEEYEMNMAFYQKLIPAAKKYGVCICLENMFDGSTGHIVEAVCSDFADAVQYIDELNAIAGEEIFGFCYDVGHATLLGKNQRRSLNILGKRVKALHIHDNDGRSDLHMQPFAYSRGRYYVTEWDELLAGLSDIGYDGVLSFETFHSLTALPDPLKPSMLSYIAACGRYFSEVIEASK